MYFSQDFRKGSQFEKFVECQEGGTLKHGHFMRGCGLILRGKASAEKKGSTRLLLESAQETGDLHNKLQKALLPSFNSINF